MQFPHIDPEAIFSIMEVVQEAQKDPRALKDAPYLPEFVEYLRTLVSKEVVHAESLEDLESEVARLHKDLEDLVMKIDADDTEGMTAYIKLKATLIGRLVDMKATIYNAKAHRAFQDRMLRAIDRVMTADQRTKFMEELEHV